MIFLILFRLRGMVHRPVLLGCLALAACGENQSASSSSGEPSRSGITVAVAASMRPAFEKLAPAFEKRHPSIEVEASYGSSGSFFAQLSQEAPFDLFLSADSAYPERLVAEGHAEAAFPYATGRLVLWAPRSAGLEVAARGMKALEDGRVARVAIANPELAPYGRAAIAAIRHAGLEEQVRPKLVTGENVGQCAQFVQSGAAQLGLFSYSLTFAGEMASLGDLWLVPESSHERIVQSGVISTSSQNREAAEALRDFLLGPEGRTLLESQGFGTP